MVNVSERQIFKKAHKDAEKEEEEKLKDEEEDEPEDPKAVYKINKRKLKRMYSWDVDIRVFNENIYEWNLDDCREAVFNDDKNYHVYYRMA